MRSHCFSLFLSPKSARYRFRVLESLFGNEARFYMFRIFFSEGPSLGSLTDATHDITLVETDTPRQEAEAIALKLREAAAANRKAALVTPDRNLTRQVAAALDRWNLVPDDSAGVPLAQTASGRLLRQIIEGLEFEVKGFFCGLGVLFVVFFFC